MLEATSSIMVKPCMPAPDPTIDSRLTAPDGPGTWGGSANAGALLFAYDQLGFGEQYRDERVDHHSALTYSAVWACVRVISQTLASVGWHVYQRDGRAKLEIHDDIAWNLGMQANPEMSAFDWRQVMAKDALTWGNGYAEIERTGTGKPAWMWRIAPHRVALVRDDEGSLWYEISNGPGEKCTWLHPSNVFHLKGLGPDGMVGYSVVEMARRGIKLGLYEEKFGSDVFSKGPMPGGVLTIPGNLNHEQRQQYRRDFEQIYSGSHNNRKVVVLSNGVAFTPTTIPNDDAQFLESRKFQATDICRWYGVPPHKVGDLDRATFSNIEEQEIAFVRDCILPWARRLETEADIKLFGRTHRGQRFTRLNLEGLQRGNSTTQTETVSKKVTSGLLTPNEGREYLDMNPQDNGDVLLIQGAMTTLERVIAAPTAEPVSQPPVNPNPKPAQDDGDVESCAKPFRSILIAAYSRLFRVDIDKARRADNKGKLTEHIHDYYADAGQVPRIAAMLLPVFQGALLAMRHDIETAEALAQVAASRHVAWCVRELSRGDVLLSGWADRSEQSATADFQSIISGGES